MSQQDDQEELKRLREENAKLKKKNNQLVTFKVSDKGGVSVYGLGQRFPVTLYKEQWQKLFEYVDALKEFLRTHDHELKEKD